MPEVVTRVDVKSARLPRRDGSPPLRPGQSLMARASAAHQLPPATLAEVVLHVDDDQRRARPPYVRATAPEAVAYRRGSHRYRVHDARDDREHDQLSGGHPTGGIDHADVVSDKSSGDRGVIAALSEPSAPAGQRAVDQLSVPFISPPGAGTSCVATAGEETAARTWR